ncbi:MAG TPA: hypothetical protein VJP60_02300 [Rhizomicrobium sp.]|nr:hypothetical protein [Rhizomicrobium sp.]
MTDDHYRLAGEDKMLRTVLAAVMLIAAGLGLMVWQDYQDAKRPVTVSLLHRT